MIRSPSNKALKASGHLSRLCRSEQLGPVHSRMAGQQLQRRQKTCCCEWAADHVWCHRRFNCQFNLSSTGKCDSYPEKDEKDASIFLTDFGKNRMPLVICQEWLPTCASSPSQWLSRQSSPGGFENSTKKLMKANESLKAWKDTDMPGEIRLLSCLTTSTTCCHPWKHEQYKNGMG